ncbi:MAG: hypothetical protein Q8896_09220 [Bacteroidota bacterium]|nr:hypothetical protein [Bacteroidota bacterium]
MKKRTWTILGSVAVVLLGIAGYGYYQYSRGNADLTNTKADVCIAAPALFKEFSENEGAANAKYLNKVTCARGVLKAVSTDHTGSVSLALDSGDPIADVSCQLDARHIEEAKKLHTGDTVNVTGICSGMLTDVVLVRCTFDEDKRQ